MKRLKIDPPRVSTASMYLSSLTSLTIPSLEPSKRKEIISFGRWFRSKVSCKILIMAWFEFSVSSAPFRTQTLPVLKQSAAPSEVIEGRSS